MYSILVVGDDGTNTLGLIRSLGEAGYKPDAIITSSGKPVHLRKSVYIGRYKIIEKSNEALLSALTEFESYGKKYYLFPTSDFVLKCIGDNSDKLKEKYYMPSVSGETESLSSLLDKSFTFDFARKAGFSVPKSLKLTVNDNSVNSSDWTDYFEGDYPLIIKPENSFSNECGFFIANSKDELIGIISRLSGSTIIIQQYINDAEELDIQCVGFGTGKKAAVFGVIHKIRTSVFALGTTSYAKLTDFEDNGLMEKCSSFSELLGFSGIYDLDILYKNGVYYFIECNFRNGSNGYAYTKAGFNLPLIWIEHQNNRSNPELIDFKNPLYFISDIGDFAHVLKKDISFIKWLYQYITADCRLSFNFTDQKPFWDEIICYFKTKRVV